MSAGIIIVIIVIAAIVVVAVAAGVLYDARRRRLRQRFGPEYDRLVEERESRRKAEAELAGREKRVKDLDIRPLDPAARSQYADQWALIQERFVDAPQEAVAEAQRVVMAVMNERGYPTEGSEQVLADLSVDHASTLDHYRAAHDISHRAADNMASTEDLRLAMIHYRALFQDLLGPPSGPEAADGTAQVVPDQARVAPEPAAVVADRDTVVSDETAVPDETAVTDDAMIPDQETEVPGRATVLSASENGASGRVADADQPVTEVPGEAGEAGAAAADLPRQRRR